MSASPESFVELMNVQQALGSVRAFCEGQTTFLTALKHIELADAAAAPAIDAEIASLPDSTIARFLIVALRLLREGKGTPEEIASDALAVLREANHT